MSNCSIKFLENTGKTIFLPSSKSICNRALVISALAGAGNIGNLSPCDDTKAVIRALGNNGTTIDVGAAGTAMRFLTAYFAQKTGSNIVITGSERMKNRPIGILVDALNSIGAEITYAEKSSYPPLNITGRQLQGGEIEIDAGVSSQYISALLMIAPLCEKGLTLNFKGNPASRPYIEMTLKVMESFGVNSSFIGNAVSVPPQKYAACDYLVEGDWSAASYWYEIATLLPQGQSVRLKPLNADSLQGDSCVATIFKGLGVETLYKDGEIEISRRNKPAAFLKQDFSACPDLAQTLVLTCCLMNIPFDFTGLKSLRIKETDRIAALQNECAKLGYVLHNEGDDRLYFEGGRNLPLDEMSVIGIDTYDDHRMAMAFAPAALLFDNIVINNAEVVSKSYPSFWDDLKKIGFEINFL